MKKKFDGINIQLQLSSKTNQNKKPNTAPSLSTTVKNEQVKQEDEDRNAQYNILITDLMMRYISSNPDSLDLIHKIVTETFEEINITLDNLKVFWSESLLPHLEKDVSAFS